MVAVSATCNDHGPMRDVRQFFRQNPQVLVLLVICLVLGLGTFLAVMFGLVSAHSGTNTGEPSGSITPVAAAVRAAIGLYAASVTPVVRSRLAVRSAVVRRASRAARRSARARRNRCPRSRAPARCSGPDGLAPSRPGGSAPSAAGGGEDGAARRPAGRRGCPRSGSARRASDLKKTGTYVRESRGRVGRRPDRAAVAGPLGAAGLVQPPARAVRRRGADRSRDSRRQLLRPQSPATTTRRAWFAPARSRRR